MADRRPPRREGQSPRRATQGSAPRGPQNHSGSRRPRPSAGSPTSAPRRRPGLGPLPKPAVRKPRPDRVKKTDGSDIGDDRLQKILAHAGLGSRRACEELILQGRVTVDRVVIRELGSKVDPKKCNIQVDGQSIRVEKPVYFAVNKPKGYVSTNADPSGRPRVIDLMPELPERIYTVGRLDEMSVGLILLTNDGELANKLTHPKYGVEKLYRVVVAGFPNDAVLAQLTEGIWLAEGKVRAKRVRVAGKQGEATILEMVLAEGKNREVRRMLAKLGHKVMSLTRVAVGPVTLRGLKFGQWRPLTALEIEQLHKVAAGIPVSMPWMMADRPTSPRPLRRGAGRTDVGGAGAAPHLGGPSGDRDRRPGPGGMRDSRDSRPSPAPRFSAEGTFPGRRPVGPRFSPGGPARPGRPGMNDGPRPPRQGFSGQNQDGPRPERRNFEQDGPTRHSFNQDGPRPPRQGFNQDGPRPPRQNFNQDGPRPPRQNFNQDGPRPPRQGFNQDGPRPPRQGFNQDGPRPPRQNFNQDGPRPPRQGFNQDGPRPARQNFNQDGPRPPRQNFNQDGPRPPRQNFNQDGPRAPRRDLAGPGYQDRPRPQRQGYGSMNQDGPRPNSPPRGRREESDRPTPPRVASEQHVSNSDAPRPKVRPMKGDAPSPGMQIRLPEGLPPSQRPPGVRRPGMGGGPRPGGSAGGRGPGRGSSEPLGRKIIGFDQGPSSQDDGNGARMKRRPKPLNKPRRRPKDE